MRDLNVYLGKEQIPSLDKPKFNVPASIFPDIVLSLFLSTYV